TPPAFAAPPDQPAAPEDGAEAPATDESDGPGISRSMGGIDTIAPEVATNRLPTVGAPAPGETGAEAEDPVSDPRAETEEPPLRRFAAPFDAPEDRPLMAVILLDDGPGGLGPEALQGLGFPVSVAVDAQAPGARETMQAYRAQGREVLAMGALPEDARPQDAEVALAAWFDAVPEAVALMERGEGLLQPGREISEQLADYLADSGHGLVLFPQGLDTGVALAGRAGVPAATVFRDFDGAGQDARAIRRFLDNAAFRARQEGAVIMVGRLRAETLSALTFWALQDRAESVALAPVSSILKTVR
ncbi:MAG: divergent polysaccharide deacetylase family protein, partial [Paracoccaceae bacterium]